MPAWQPFGVLRRKEAGVVNTRVGDLRLVIAYIPEHDTIVAFDRMKAGEELQVDDVDVFGNTAKHGQLERVFLHNGVLRAVWAHYHPDTILHG